MDTVVHDEEERAELAALRRRAFGPDADILDDPVALQRLRQLEGSVTAASALALSSRWSSPFPDADEPPSASAPNPSFTGPVLADPALVAAADSREPVGVEDEDGPWREDEQTWAAHPPLRRWREAVAKRMVRHPGRAVSVVVAAVLIAAVGGAIGWQVAQPHPDRILAADGTRYTPSGQGTDLWLKEMYGITGAFHGHERYGHIHVFTGTARDGSECMVLIIGTDDAVGTSCSPRPLPASADLFVFPGWTKEYTGLDLPAGSVVRFVQSGDEVQVWTAIMPTSAPTL